MDSANSLPRSSEAPEEITTSRSGNSGSTLARACAAWLLPTLILLSVPLNVLARNRQELAITELELWALLGLFAAAGAVFTLLFVMAPRFRLLGWTARVAVRLSVVVFAWMVVGTLSHNYGTSLRGAVISESLLAAVLIAAMFRARFSFLCIVLAPLTAAQMLLGLAVGIPILLDLHRNPPARAATHTPTRARPLPDTAASHKGNVYHIIVDSYQDEAYTKLTQDKPELALEGFQHYTPFISNYPTTSWVTRTLVSGRYLDNGMSASDWNSDTSLWKDLADNGVAVSVYTYIPFADYSNVAHLRVLTDYRKECLAPASLRWVARNDPALLSWVDLIFLNAAPVSVRNYVNRDFHRTQTKNNVGYGFSITQYFERSNVNFQHYPYFSVGLFHEMMRDELARPATGQYVFFHLALPHLPNVFDANVNYLGPDSGQTQGYAGSMAMHEAALRLMRQFIDVLHQTGHFDNATIMIHGDHGRWWAFPPQLANCVAPLAAIKENSAPTEEDVPTNDPNNHALQAKGIASRTSALLLAKLGGIPNPPPLDAPVQTVDLSATILRHFGLADPTFAGLPLQEPVGIHDRPVVSFFLVDSEVTCPIHTSLPKFVLRDRRFEFKEDVIIP